MSDPKIPWNGLLVSVQPRIRLTRSYDERSHSYLGFVLRVQGTLGAEEREFLVAIGEAAQAKHEFRAGDQVGGEGLPVEDPRLEVAELYKVSALKLLARGAVSGKPPTVSPWVDGPPPALLVYRERGHRRLDARTYDAKCSRCIWGCRMAVEMIVDHWNPHLRRYRQETFCYGPLSCPLYKAGPTRKVPGRKGMSWEEEDWVDQQEVSHRGPED